MLILAKIPNFIQFLIRKRRLLKLIFRNEFERVKINFFATKTLMFCPRNGEVYKGSLKPKCSGFVVKICVFSDGYGEVRN